MKRGIKSVKAIQVYTRRRHPGVEAVVITEGGQTGRALCTAGVSIGSHEVKFQYDGGEKWHGKGVMKAVNNVNDIIGPALIGMDSADQYAIDEAMLKLRPNAKETLGGNAIAAVSAAVLKAGAAAMEIPLYRHIGGANAIYMPVPGVPAAAGDKRYGGGVTTPFPKPTYSFMCHDFSSFSEASYAGWEVQQVWRKKMTALGVDPADQYDIYIIGPGHFKTDEELWEVMAKTIVEAGYEGKVGIQVDVASDTYYDRKEKLYRGLFSDKPKSSEEMMELYIKAVKDYPFVIIEDPFYEDDYENHARIVKEVDIQIVGDDLFTTMPSRVAHGAAIGAANTVLLKVNQVGTISETLEMVQLAYNAGYGVMPCESRGEGATIADYSVGINACSVRECAVGELANRFLEIELELGGKARFQGTAGLRGSRFQKKI